MKSTKTLNAVIDKGCQELENEIKQLEPEGNKLTNSTLKQATLNLNSKLRRRGNISAFEINSSRDQNTGHNLSLDDQKLRINQINKRREMHKNVHIAQVGSGEKRFENRKREI